MYFLFLAVAPCLDSERSFHEPRPKPPHRLAHTEDRVAHGAHLPDLCGHHLRRPRHARDARDAEAISAVSGTRGWPVRHTAVFEERVADGCGWLKGSAVRMGWCSDFGVEGWDGLIGLDEHPFRVAIGKDLFRGGLKHPLGAGKGY